MTTALQTALTRAQQAEQEAVRAAQRAAELKEKADAAAMDALREQEARRRRWAEGVTGSFDADAKADLAAIRETKRAFTDAVLADPAAAPSAYLAWVEAAVRARQRYETFANAAATLGLTIWNGIGAPTVTSAPPTPPAWSQAVDAAMASAFTDVAERVRAEADAAMDALLQGEDGDGA